MKYILKNIELWDYNGKDFPSLIQGNSFIIKHINKKYTVKEFEVLLSYIYNELEKDGWHILATMNPLYPDLGFTVLSIDISKNLISTQENKTNSNNPRLNVLVEKHKSLSKKLFSQKLPNIKHQTIKKILYSQDNKLRSVEDEIHKFILRNNYIFKLTINNISYNDLYAMRWANKNNKLLDIIISILNTKNERNKNMALLILIPMIKELPTEMQNKIFNILISTTLRYPCSAVRNKALSLISLLPTNLLILDDKMMEFINIIANSDQVNSSFPSMKIMKKILKIDI